MTKVLGKLAVRTWSENTMSFRSKNSPSYVHLCSRTYHISSWLDVHAKQRCSLWSYMVFMGNKDPLSTGFISLKCASITIVVKLTHKLRRNLIVLRAKSCSDPFARRWWEPFGSECNRSLELDASIRSMIFHEFNLLLCLKLISSK